MASRGFWRELKRRHVYRVAAAYALVGWLLIQVATQVFPVLHLPDRIDQAVVLLILLGFPIALVLAWAFDATPHGIVRTCTLDGADVQTARRSRRAGIAVGLIGLLIALLAGVFCGGRNAPTPCEMRPLRLRNTYPPSRWQCCKLRVHPPRCLRSRRSRFPTNPSLCCR